VSSTYELFSQWKAAKGHKSDNAGAIALGVTRGAVSLWKSGRNADADVIERLAKELGQSPAAWAARAMSEQAKGEAARAWARIAKQLSTAAVLAVVAALPLTSQAAVSAGKFAGNAYYVLRRWLAPRPAIPSRATFSPA